MSLVYLALSRTVARKGPEILECHQANFQKGSPSGRQTCAFEFPLSSRSAKNGVSKHLDQVLCCSDLSFSNIAQLADNEPRVVYLSGPVPRARFAIPLLISDTAVFLPRTSTCRAFNSPSLGSPINAMT